MDRKPMPHYDGDRYPDRRAVPDRRTFLAQLGLAAGAVAVGTLSKGCIPIGGDISEPNDNLFDLPLGGTSRELYFDHGSIGYHLEIEVVEMDTRTWIQDNSQHLLLQIDQALLEHSVYDFAPGEPTTAIQTEVTQVIADEYHATEGAPLTDFRQCYLSIDAYDSWEDVPGDAEA
jgi:hypothetical protein